MKKFIAIFILFNFISLNCAFCEPIFDEFVNSTLDKNLKIKKQNQEIFEDELVKSTLNPNLKIKKFEIEPIIDDTIPFVFKRKSYIAGDRNQKFDFESTAQEIIKITPIQYYTTKRNLNEGEYIKFSLMEDINLNNKTYKKGKQIKARVENVTKNSAYGVPAEVIVDNFLIDNNIIDATLTIKGANRTAWVYPCGYILSAFFGLGILIFPIRGGHAKFKPTKTYELKLNY